MRMSKKHQSSEHVVDPVQEAEAEHEANHEHGHEQDQHITDEDEVVGDEVDLEEENYVWELRYTFNSRISNGGNSMKARIHGPFIFPLESWSTGLSLEDTRSNQGQSPDSETKEWVWAVMTSPLMTDELPLTKVASAASSSMNWIHKYPQRSNGQNCEAPGTGPPPQSRRCRSDHRIRQISTTIPELRQGFACNLQQHFRWGTKVLHQHQQFHPRRRSTRGKAGHCSMTLGSPEV